MSKLADGAAQDWRPRGTLVPWQPVRALELAASPRPSRLRSEGRWRPFRARRLRHKEGSGALAAGLGQGLPERAGAKLAGHKEHGEPPGLAP